MNRQKFCKMLIEARYESGIKRKDMCFSMDTVLTTLYRIEHGYNNYSIDNVFKYIDAINCIMVIYDSDNEENFYVQNREKFKLVLKAMRAMRGLSQVKAAERARLQPSIIVGIEILDKNVSIDNFLKCVYGLGYKIKIKVKDNG